MVLPLHRSRLAALGAGTRREVALYQPWSMVIRITDLL